MYIVARKAAGVRRINFVGSKAEIALCCDIMSKGSGLSKVWGKVHSAADIHSYRADYATKVYQMHARPIETLNMMRYIIAGVTVREPWLDKMLCSWHLKPLGIIVYQLLHQIT